MDVKFNEAVQSMPNNFKKILLNIPEQIKTHAYEIRLRAGCQIIVAYETKKFNLPKIPSPSEINDCFLALCDYSVHCHLNEIKQGFLTIKGGHRVGLCATAVYDENGSLINLKQISSINIRIAKQINYAADELINQLKNNVGKLLIIGPPASGKTTILKAIAKHLKSKNVSIIDTRGEIAACFNCVAQNDVGNADIFNFWNRNDGILAAIKTMNPDYIICDEIGNIDDLNAIKLSTGSGVELIATAHGKTLDDINKRPLIKQILKTNAFENVAVLEGKFAPCKLKYIIKVSDLIENSWNFNFSNMPNHFWNRSVDKLKIK